MNIQQSNRLYLFIIVFTAITIGFIIGYVVGSGSSKSPSGPVQSRPSQQGRETPSEDLSRVDLKLQERIDEPSKTGHDNPEKAGDGIKEQLERVTTHNKDNSSEEVSRETQKEGYTVQVGAFKNEKEAQALETKLKKKGYNNIIYMVKEGKSGTGLFKIRIGDFKTKKEAEIFAIKLHKTEGLEAFATKK